MSKTVGIDLGTTNSCVAVLEGGEPTVIANAEGFRTTPSIVAFSKDGEVLVGEQAKRQAVTNVDNTISSVKRHMGSSWKKNIDGHSYTPEEISARILMKLKKDAEAFLGDTVDSAVITVPAYFDDSQRNATKTAGKIAGLKVLRVVNEPTAAAVAYGLNKAKANERILIYDLGGGTFDVSLLSVDKDPDDDFSTIQVEATAGDNHLGGDDWDKALMDYLIKDFKVQTGVDISGDKIALQRLKEASEQAKKELSNNTQTSIQLPYLSLTENGPVNLDTTITRAKFEELTKSLLEKTHKPFQQVLDDANITSKDIDHVILVGGSTRMPAVVDLVKELSGKDPNKTVNPDEVVALGAAIQAGIVTGERKDILLIDVTPLTLSIETLGGIATPMIERNTAIPTQHSEMFTTAADNQNVVSVQVYQGERKFVRDNKKLGQFDLMVAPAPRGVPQVEVTFDIDRNGIVNVTAVDKGTGKEQKISITGGNQLSKEEVERMVREAEQHSKEDDERKAKAEIRNNAEQLAYVVDKLLKDNADKLPTDVKTEVETDVVNLRKALEGSDDDAVKRAYDTLNTSQSKIGEALYQQQQGSSSSQEAPNTASSSDDDVVDAEVVDE